MNIAQIFESTTNKDKDSFIKTITEESSPSMDFFLMMGLSTLMATFGLLINSAAVIIGSMLVAPLLYPLMSLALGVVIADWKAISRSLYTSLKSVVIAIILAVLTTWLFSSESTLLGDEILARTQPTLAYAAVALISGFAGAFAGLKPSLNEHLPGVAISVSLIPPLAVVGIAIAKLDAGLLRGSLLLFLINVVCVVFAGVIIFSLSQLAHKKTVVKAEIAKDERKIKKEKSA